MPRRRNEGVTAVSRSEAHGSASDRGGHLLEAGVIESESMPKFRRHDK